MIRRRNRVCPDSSSPPPCPVPCSRSPGLLILMRTAATATTIRLSSKMPLEGRHRILKFRSRQRRWRRRRPRLLPFPSDQRRGALQRRPPPPSAIEARVQAQAVGRSRSHLGRGTAVSVADGAGVGGVGTEGNFLNVKVANFFGSGSFFLKRHTACASMASARFRLFLVRYPAPHLLTLDL